jgi:prevent-host-death family protein
MPEYVGVREVKAHLSAFLGRVRRGEVITISDRGRPVARLVPIEELSLADRIRELEAAGWISPGASAGSSALEPVHLEDYELAQALLREDRNAR